MMGKDGEAVEPALRRLPMPKLSPFPDQVYRFAARSDELRESAGESMHV